MKAIIFDFDGTLLDSKERHTILLRDVCSQLRVPLTSEQYDLYLPYKQNGYGTKYFLMQKCNMPEELANECTKYWVKGIEKWNYLEYDALYPDSTEILKSLFGKFQMYLLSARQNENYLHAQLEKFHLSNYFQDVFCVSPDNARKQKAEIARELRDVICFVGDTEIDHAAAKHAGCMFYALNRGFRSKEFWLRLNITSYSSFSQFINIVNREE